MPKKAQFRFYEELNDFLPAEKRKVTFTYNFMGSPSVKDAVEAIGVPHTEIDLILVNGKSVSFSYHLAEGDDISVYPVFESMDIAEVTRLREKPLREAKFVLDVHLGRLAKYLRMFGFDTLYDNSYSDSEIVNISAEGKRIILTRDTGLLKNKKVKRGYWIRSQYPKEQLKEVMLRFDLFSNIKPFCLCMECNGNIEEVKKELIIDNLQPKTKEYYDEFYRCISCEKIYWKGTHYESMIKLIKNIKTGKGEHYDTK